MNINLFVYLIKKHYNLDCRQVLTDSEGYLYTEIDGTTYNQLDLPDTIITEYFLGDWVAFFNDLVANEPALLNMLAFCEETDSNFVKFNFQMCLIYLLSGNPVPNLLERAWTNLKVGLFNEGKNFFDEETVARWNARIDYHLLPESLKVEYL